MLADLPLADPIPQKDAPAQTMWALVEIFGHRRHYGRVSEVERFGTKMMRVDVPEKPPAPLLGEPDEIFRTFFYGGGSIFSITPLTEEAARKAAVEMSRDYRPLRIGYDGDDDDRDEDRDVDKPF